MISYSSYGTRELIKLLTCLGYKPQRQVGSRHLKYRSPNKVVNGIYPFILVIQNKKEFDPHWQKEYIKQISRHGFSEKQINLCFP